MEKIKMGISSCLLGNSVRYNGGHVHDRFLTQTLGEFIDFIPVCPEVEIGLGIPREALRLVGDSDHPRLLTQKTGVDYTDKMISWAENRLKDLEKSGICGFIFKSRSPSSGLHRVKVYKENGTLGRPGMGIFAREFTTYFPDIPAEESGRLHDLGLREIFLSRVFGYFRSRTFQEKQSSPGDLVTFHARNKYYLMAHHQATLKEMGKIVARGKTMPFKSLLENYFKLFLKALSYKGTVKKNVNVLYHILGYFKQELSDWEKGEMIGLIEEYQGEKVPLIAVITLLKHYVSKYDKSYLKDQYYLNPHPLEVRLRNHV